jgi:branched-chain amino acid transport system permease protein
MLTYAVSGLAAGVSFSLLGLALTLTFRATRTVNFSVAAIGTIGTLAFASLYNDGLPLWLAALAGVAIGCAVGLALGAVVVRWFEDASVETKSAVTIAMLVTFLALGTLLWGGESEAVPSALQGSAFVFARVPVTQSTLLGLIVAVGLAVGISLFIDRTRTGKRLQAVSERSHTSQLLGISAHRYGLWVWGLSSAFAVCAVWVIAGSSATQFSSLSLTVVPALAAALFGLFRSLAWTVVGGLLLGVLQSMMASSAALSPYSSALPFLALLVILLYAQRGQRWGEAR